jgi:hypothetical protein
VTSRPKLSVVGQEAATAPNSRAETTLRQWDTESQLVGALMHLARAQVVPILDLVPDDAIWRPDNRWAYLMYSRTVCDSPTRSVLETLCWRWSGLAANLRNNAVSGSLIAEAPR